MVDDLAGLMDQADAPAETPPAQPTDQASSGSDVEERIKGFQRLIAERDQRLDALERQIEEQRLASLPEEERDTFRHQQASKEVEKLRLENELLKVQRDFPPEVFEAYTTLLSGKSATEQLSFLAKKLVTTQPAAVAPPAVNKNNPQRTPPKGVVLSDGTVMNDDIADRILNSLTRVPRQR